MNTSDTSTRAPEEEQEQPVPEESAPEAEQPAPEKPEEAAGTEAPEEPKPEAPPLSEAETLAVQLVQKQDQLLRRAAEYDNYRKRSARDKESLQSSVKKETAAKFIPVLESLEKALEKETEDKAFRKGVEMTRTQLRDVLIRLNAIEAQPPDPSERSVPK